MSIRGIAAKSLLLPFSIGILVAVAEASAQGRPSTGSSVTDSVAPNEIVLKVGSTALSAAQFEKLVQALPAQFAAALETQGKLGFAQQYAGMLILAEEAQRRKLDQGEQFEQRIAFERIALLSRLTVDALAESLKEVNQEDINFFYSSREEYFEQASVRGVYIPFEPAAPTSGSGSSVNSATGSRQPASQQQGLTERQALGKARILEQRIRAGESMEQIARQESQHPTAAEGGSFGYVRRDQLETRIANAIFALVPNRVSTPIKDQSGYYLFVVEAKRIQPLAEVRSLIENSLRQQRLSEVIGNLTSKASIELNPNFFTDPVGNSGPGSR